MIKNVYKILKSYFEVWPLNYFKSREKAPRVEKVNISVVVATVGEPSLENTIFSLNNGSLRPEEILICIPGDFAERVEKFTQLENVKIVKTEIKGQVGQRCEGFKLARNDLVLQLDSDIQLDKNCLAELVNCLGANKQAAVAPKLYNVKTKEYYSFLIPQKHSILEKIVYWVINSGKGFEAGKISCSGVNMGVPDIDEDVTGLDWLPGGCILHRSENLVRENYYTFSGKAFAEDLFHSLKLKERSVSLVLSSKARCEVDLSSSDSFNLKRFAKGYFAYAKVMHFYNRLNNRSNIRFNLFIVLNLGYQFFLKLTNQSKY